MSSGLKHTRLCFVFTRLIVTAPLCAPGTGVTLICEHPHGPCPSQRGRPPAECEGVTWPSGWGRGSRRDWPGRGAHFFLTVTGRPREWHRLVVREDESRAQGRDRARASVAGGGAQSGDSVWRGDRTTWPQRW